MHQQQPDSAPAGKHVKRDGSAALSAEAAIEYLLSDVEPPGEVERIPVAEAYGRVLAEDMRADADVPPAANSAMDGYAVASADVRTEGETRLPVSQRIPAGTAATALTRGTAARLFTGSEIPKGADAVVMQEFCRADDGTVVIPGPVSAGQHVRSAGEDLRAGVTVLEAGSRLRPQDMGLAASVGAAELRVYRRARMALLSTGDELADPGTPLAPGQIYNSNRYTLIGLAQALGCEIIDLGIVRDTPESVADAMRAGADAADVIVATGGVSVGEEDHVRHVVETLGEIKMWQVAIKPGHPLAYGRVRETPFFGLPGNPVSVFVTFALFARPYVLRLQGVRDVLPRPVRARARFAYRPRGRSRRVFLQARLERGEAGAAEVCIYQQQGSGVFSATGWANALAVISEGERVEVGTPVDVLPFNELIS